MTAAMVAGAVGFFLTLSAGASALAALAARSIFAMCMYLTCAAALAAAAQLGWGAGEAGLSLAVVGATWAPLLLLAAMMLSARTVRVQRQRWLWASVAAAGAIAALLAAPVLNLGPTPQAPSAGDSGFAFWIAPLALAAAAGCVGLLGYGERGVFTSRRLERRD